jgi:hypothetical protein
MTASLERSSWLHRAATGLLLLAGSLAHAGLHRHENEEGMNSLVLPTASSSARFKWINKILDDQISNKSKHIIDLASGLNQELSQYKLNIEQLKVKPEGKDQLLSQLIKLSNLLQDFYIDERNPDEYISMPPDDPLKPIISRFAKCNDELRRSFEGYKGQIADFQHHVQEWRSILEEFEKVFSLQQRGIALP